MFNEGKVVDKGSESSLEDSEKVRSSPRLDVESLLVTLANLSEADRKEILYSISPEDVIRLVEMLAAETTAKVEAQAFLAPNIDRWARKKGVL